MAYKIGDYVEVLGGFCGRITRLDFLWVQVLLEKENQPRWIDKNAVKRMPKTYPSKTKEELEKEFPKGCKVRCIEPGPNVEYLTLGAEYIVCERLGALALGELGELKIFDDSKTENWFFYWRFEKVESTIEIGDVVECVDQSQNIYIGYGKTYEVQNIVTDPIQYYIIADDNILRAYTPRLFKLHEKRIKNATPPTPVMQNTAPGSVIATIQVYDYKYYGYSSLAQMKQALGLE